MFGGNWHRCQRDAKPDWDYFIPRDPKTFEQVLKSFTDGTIVCTGLDRHATDAVIEACVGFNVAARQIYMVELLFREIDTDAHLPPDGSGPQREGGLLPSCSRIE